MQVKNKILERLDESIRADYYEMLEDGTQLAIGNPDTPPYYNVVKCGEDFIIIKPKDNQLPFCKGRVMSLYDFFPYMRDEGDRCYHVGREIALRTLSVAKEQYDPDELFDYLRQGYIDGTLRNFVEYELVEEKFNPDIRRTISIVDTYTKGKWTNTSCMVYGDKPTDFVSISYSLDRDRKRAMRFFGKRLSGENKTMFDMLDSQKGAEAE